MTVNTTADNTTVDGKVSLREAITAANSNFDLNADVTAFRTGTYGTDDIVFDAALFAAPQQIKLLTALPFIIGNVNLQGTSAANVTVMRDPAAGTFRVFSIDIVGPGSVSMSNITISGGTGPGAGIILQDESVTLTNCVVSGNSASGVDGGGVRVFAGGRLTVLNCTFSNNSAAFGGAIDFYPAGGTLILENSTLSGNSVSSHGGAIYSVGGSNLIIRSSTISNNSAGDKGGAIYTTGVPTLSIQNSTIANNSANFGGGISGSSKIESTIVAKNTAATNSPDIQGSVTATFSLIGVIDEGPVLDRSSNIKYGFKTSPLDPQLSALANNGGPTQTLALAITSPAVNGGSNSAALTADQRGGSFVRVAGGLADIGAFEVQSNFMVTNTGDSTVKASGSLRRAILDANLSAGPDIIDFAASLSGTILLGSELSINEAVVIGAPAPGAITISGQNSVRPFNTTIAPANAAISFANLTVTKGNGGDGGAILAGDEALTLTSCVFTNNTGGIDGGVIRVNGGGSITARGCTFSNNQANYGGALDFYNGGGSLLLENCTFSGNTATNGHGGAIYFIGTVGSGGFTIRSCTMSGNRSVFSGGAITLAGFSGTATVDNSTLTMNTATGGASTGGGIAVTGGSGSVSMYNTIVYGNSAATGPDLSSPGTIIAAASLIGSTASVGTFSGDTFTKSNVSVPPNLGPLQNNGGPTFTHQPAAGSLAIGNGLYPGPFGIHTDQRGFLRASGAPDIGAVEVQLANFLVTNAADSGTGSLRQAILNANANSGLDTVSFDTKYFNVARTITLTSGELLSTDAINIVGPGPALATVNGNNANRVFNLQSLSGSTISGMTITNGNALAGGGVSGASLSIVNCIITANKANSAGGVELTSGTFSLTDSQVTNNTATFTGGIQTSGAATILRSTISGNTASGFVGGIRVNNGLTLIESTLSNNSAGTVGGGILLPAGGASLVILNSTISSNAAAEVGGGICLGYAGGFQFNGTLTVRNSTITANKATSKGNSGAGIMLIDGTGTISIESSVVSGNIAVDGRDISSTGTVNVNWSAIGSTLGFTLTGANNLPIGANLKLGPLAINGGPTQTHMPALDSPLIDQGSNPASLANDQRGSFYLRGFGAGYDIGAVEVHSTSVVAIERIDANPTAANFVSWHVFFADQQEGLSAANFTLSGPGAVSASVFGVRSTNFSSQSSTWLVTASTGGEGALELDLTNSTNLGLPPTNLSYAGQAYTVDKVPLSVSISASTTTFNDFNVGTNALTLTATFSEGMNTTIAPTFSFPVETPGLAVDFASASWTNSTTYEAKYNIFDTNLILPNIDVRVSGGQDSGGNVFDKSTKTNVFSIDTENPLVLSMTRNNPTPTNLGTVGWTVTFSEAITGLTTANFQLFNGGLTGSLILNPVTGGGTTWIVTASTGSGEGNLSLYMINSNSVTDAAGNLVAALPVQGPAYAIDHVSPQAAKISANTYTITDANVATGFQVTVEFNEPMNVGVNPTVSFPVESPFPTLSSPAGSWLDVKTFRMTYTVNDLDAYTPDIDIQITGAKDAVGNIQDLLGVTDFFDIITQQTAQVSSVTVNGGTLQRSRVTTMDVIFNRPVTLPNNPANAFQLTRITGGSASVTLAASVSSNTVTLTFTGGSVNGASLADGRYELVVLADKVSNGNFDGNGDTIIGDDYTLTGDPAIAPKLFRLYGDSDGNGTVNQTDFIAFRNAFNAGPSATFDYEGDGNVAQSDFIQFRNRFNVSV